MQTTDLRPRPDRNNSSDRPTNRADALLILRGLACLVVVIAHCQPPLAVLASMPWGWLLAMPGGIAVRVFFTLSGYLMGKGFYLGRYGTSRALLGRYLRNRAARILPLYWAAVLIPAFLLAPSILIPQAENQWVLWRYLTFTYNHTLPEPFNSPLWSLSTEVQFYAIAPLLFGLVRHRLRTVQHTLTAIGMVMIGWLMLRWMIVAILIQLHGDQTPNFNLDFVRYVYTFSLANLDAFLCGFLLNPVLLNQRKRLPIEASSQSCNLRLLFSKISQWNPLLFRGLAIVIMMGLFMQCSQWKIAGDETILAIGPTLSIAVVGLFILAFEWGDTYHDFHRNQTLSIAACQRNPWRCGESLGILSYGIYVWHYPLTIWLLPKFGELSDLGAFGQNNHCSLSCRDRCDRQPFGDRTPWRGVVSTSKQEIKKVTVQA